MRGVFSAARSKQCRDFGIYHKSDILNSIGVNPTEYFIFSKYPCKTIAFTLYKNARSVFGSVIVQRDEPKASPDGGRRGGWRSAPAPGSNSELFDYCSIYLRREVN